MLFAALKDDLLGYYRKRIILFFAIFVFISCILFARLFILQVIQYEQLSVDANRNRIKTREIIAERGFIYDSKMNLLVSNTPSYDLVLNKDDIRRGDDVIGMLKRVQEIVDFDYILGDYSYDSLRLKGFYDSRSKQCRKLNDIENLNQYIQKYCAYECRYFLLRKTKKDKKKMRQHLLF